MTGQRLATGAPGLDFSAVEQELGAAVKAGVFPGAVLLVSRDDQVVYHGATGWRSLEPERTPMRPGTIFDLSSLTKPLATSLAVLLLVQEGKVRLDDRVTRFLHNFGVHGKVHVTFRQLLAHCSGLPAWRPYYREVVRLARGGRFNFMASRGAKEYVFEQIHRERPEARPGTRAVYSDLGFMLLGELVELVASSTLDRFCHERIFRPLGLRATSFVDLSLLRARRLEPVTEMIAPTERCSWRRKVLCGEVHDDNAYAMGGVAGHAGLFSSATDLDALLAHLKAAYRGRSRLFSRELVREFWSRDAAVAGSTWALGWDTPSRRGSAAGSRFSASAVGHLGFTGTSIWLDLERNVHVILLTNRVHPSRDNERIRAFRPRIHDLVMEAVAP